MKLSILICTLFERGEEFQKLMDVLDPQKTDDVEICANIDRREKTIGTKRNELLQKAQGDYVVFVDDDDRIPDYYIEKILNAIDTKPDVVGIQGIMTTRGKKPHVFTHSIRWPGWYKKGEVFFRTPNHWNPVKRELALQAGFPEINYGEDMEYSNRLRPLLSTEVYIEDVMYYYQFNPEQSIALQRHREDRTCSA